MAKTVTKITAPKVSILPKQSKAYTIVLKTSAGKSLYKQKVTIKLNHQKKRLMLSVSVIKELEFTKHQRLQVK